MPACSVRYNFNQHFAVPALDAYKWCTDYRSNDFRLMGLNGKRSIKPISADAIILIDTFNNDGKLITKKKLVRLDPNKFSWTNTHLAGPNKHSQFLYQITAEEERSSRLEFTGLQIDYGRQKISQKEIASLTRKYREEDSMIWKRLAKEMEKDLLS